MSVRNFQAKSKFLAPNIFSANHIWAGFVCMQVDSLCKKQKMDILVKSEVPGF